MPIYDRSHQPAERSRASRPAWFCIKRRDSSPKFFPEDDMSIKQHGTVKIADGGHVEIEGFTFENCDATDGAMLACTWAIHVLLDRVSQLFRDQVEEQKLLPLKIQNL